MREHVTIGQTIIVKLSKKLHKDDNGGFYEKEKKDFRWYISFANDDWSNVFNGMYFFRLGSGWKSIGIGIIG